MDRLTKEYNKILEELGYSESSFEETNLDEAKKAWKLLGDDYVELFEQACAIKKKK